MVDNKMQKAGVISNFLRLSQEKINRMIQNAPEQILRAGSFKQLE